MILDLSVEADFSSFTIWDSMKMNRKYDPNFSENQGKKKRTLVCMSIHTAAAQIFGVGSSKSAVSAAIFIFF